ncbi:MAG TPA: BadF/BadG/BcrA/BcrD ATPase family protein [Candidatus Tumulicola sp.]|jgi:N-acetylglucosamine kinase-like BadF-type ATPase
MGDNLFAGIDGGQSSTRAVVGTGDGQVLGRGAVGGADEVGATTHSTRLRDALRDALAAAVANAGLPADAQFDTIVAGVSGFDGAHVGRPPELPARETIVLHDAPIALAGALDGEAGIVVIAGTGTVAYAANANSDDAKTYGGWGYLFGDEGSAFWLVREALAQMMRHEDDGRPLDAPANAIRAYFGVDSLREIVSATHAGRLTRDRLASYAPSVLKAAPFDHLARRGVQRLAELVGAAVRDGAAPRVALIGGMFANADYRERVGAAIERLGVRIVPAKRPPAEGAMLLAIRAAGG